MTVNSYNINNISISRRKRFC